MNRIQVSVAGVAAVSAIIWLGFGQAIPIMGQQQTRCADRLRRAEGIRLARRINTAQFQSMQEKKIYQPLTAFPAIVIPEDFSVQFVAGPTGYVFSIKDTTDPCEMALFSDQGGLIYTAAPLE